MAKSFKKNIFIPWTLIKYHGYKFIITDSPTSKNISAYTDLFLKMHVSTIIRVCEPAYDRHFFECKGIQVTDLFYQDGTFLPEELIREWLNHISIIMPINNETEKKCVVVHCTSGLGRAPVLVCLSLIEAGMDALNAISYIRKHRHGCFNQTQIDGILNYKPNRKENHCCLLM